MQIRFFLLSFKITIAYYFLQKSKEITTSTNVLRRVSKYSLQILLFCSLPIKWYNVGKEIQYASLGKNGKYYNMYNVDSLLLHTFRENGFPYLYTTYFVRSR